MSHAATQRIEFFRLHDRDTAVHTCNADTYSATRTLMRASWKSGSDSERPTRLIHSRYREPLYSTDESDGKGMERGAGALLEG
jgi:hypothetical protein